MMIVDMKFPFKSFFAPQKIAFIGASEKGLYPAGIMQNLIEYGYRHRIFPINPNRTNVFGILTHPSVLDLPERPDLALLTVPRQSVIPVTQQCIQKGIPAILVITAGFGESDQTGKQLQKELKKLLASSPTRMIGPNCAGLASITDGFVATRLNGRPFEGPVSFVSQSGALMMSLQGVFSDRRIGMSQLVSLGNQIDIHLAEMIIQLIENPDTRIISAFMEGLTQGKELVNAFRMGLQVGKPIILLKTGRTQLGMAAAATHTAALAGEDRIFQAICDQFGVIQVDDINPLMDTVQLATALGSVQKKDLQFAFISQSGGMGSLTADHIEYNNINAPPLTPSLVNQLHQLGTIPSYVTLLNPADVRGASVRGEAVAKTLTAFLQSPEFDVVVMLFARSALSQYSIETAQIIVETASNFHKPVLVVWSGKSQSDDGMVQKDAREILSKGGIPCFSQPSSLLSAINRLNRYWRYREIWIRGFSEKTNHE